MLRIPLTVIRCTHTHTHTVEIWRRRKLRLRQKVCCVHTMALHSGAWKVVDMLVWLLDCLVPPEATAPLLKIKSPPASSQTARLQEQLKPKIQRAQPPQPQEVGVARANEADKMRKAEKVEPKLKESSAGILVAKRGGEAVKQQVEKMDTGLQIKEPKVSPDVKEESGAMTATPSHPKQGIPTSSGVMGDESLLPRLITSPK